MTDHKKHFEDFTVGETVFLGEKEITRDEIIAFASEFDPQPFHLDDEAGRKSMLGGLAASGWHMCSVMMRLIVDGLLSRSASLGAPGVEDLNWLKPVYPGTVLSLKGTVLARKASTSRPEIGFVTWHFEAFSGAGEKLLEFTTPLMVRRRNPGAEA